MTIFCCHLAQPLMSPSWFRYLHVISELENQLDRIRSLASFVQLFCINSLVQFRKRHSSPWQFNRRKEIAFADDNLFIWASSVAASLRFKALQRFDHCFPIFQISRLSSSGASNHPKTIVISNAF